VLPIVLASTFGSCVLAGCASAATQPPYVDRSKMQNCPPTQQGQAQGQTPAGCTTPKPAQ
jgi:hypothetical protein